MPKPPSTADVATLEKSSKPGLKEGQTRVVNPDVQKLQAVALARETAMNGGDISAAARKFNMTVATARKRLSDHTRAGLFVQHEDALLAGIVPLAEDVIQAFLQPQVLMNAEGDLIKNKNGEAIVLPPSKEQAALAVKVYQGVGLFRKPGTQAPATQASGKKGMTLEDRIAKLRAEAEEAEAAAAREQFAEGAIDADITSERPADGTGTTAATPGELRLLTAGPGDHAERPDHGAEEPRGAVDVAESDERPAEAPGETDGAPDPQVGHGDAPVLAEVSAEPPPGPESAG